MPEGPPRMYQGTFCTGHTSMVGTTAIQFAENTMHEYMEEYKNAHKMKVKSGPGLAKSYDFLAQPKKPAPNLPVAGCGTIRREMGNNPARKAPTSSQAVGGWWNDPIFMQIKNEGALPKGKGKAPASTRITTSSEVGQYWHDPEINDTDEQMAELRAINGCKRVLPVEENSQFALEDLPTQHRLL